MKTKKVFCAAEQEITEHVVSINDNGEYVFTCECGRFIKFPGGMEASALSDALKAHKEANEGQVSKDVLEAELAAKLELLEELE